MQVYEKRPTGLSADHLRSYASTHPGPVAFAVVRTLAGLVCFAFFNTSAGVILFVVGLALLGSTVPTLRRIADHAIVRPALLLTNQPKWDGVRRKVWTLDPGDGDAVALGRALAEAIDAELGAGTTTFDEEGNFRGDTRSAVFSRDAHAPGQLAWAGDAKLSLTPTGDADGVWLRIERRDPNDPDSIAITVVSNEGPASNALKVAAHRAGV